MKRRTRIKVCGITRPQDARACADFGVDAIGIVLNGASELAVTRAEAWDIIHSLPPFVLAVPVLVDATPAEVWDVAAGLNTRTIQLNGLFPAKDLPQLAGLTILRSLRVERGLFERELAELTDSRLLATGVVGAIVLDSPAPLPGNDDVENDWDHVVRCKRRGQFDTAPPMIAAGGLTAETVGQVIRVLQPHAVDVGSGVEHDVRTKSLDRLRNFCDAVRSADAWG